MRLLFVKLKHTGDALLLTPTLVAARAAYPQAEIWVVVRQGTDGILAGCPQIHRILTSAAPEEERRTSFTWWNDLKLLRELRRQRFDYAFELSHGDRARLLVGLSGARHRCASDSVYRMPRFWRPWFTHLSAHDWSREHQVEASFNLVNEFLPLHVKEPPPLVFDRTRTVPCDLDAMLTNYVVIHPATRWQRKRWPLERWIETGHGLLDMVPKLIISVGPDVAEVQLAETITAALGPKVVSTGGRLSWAQLADLLLGARLFVGVDTAAMHLAAACQCPIVAIFGPTIATHWRPWRAQHSLVSEIAQAGDNQNPDITRISAASVLEACRTMLATGDCQ